MNPAWVAEVPEMIAATEFAPVAAHQASHVPDADQPDQAGEGSLARLVATFVAAHVTAETTLGCHKKHLSRKFAGEPPRCRRSIPRGDDRACRKKNPLRPASPRRPDFCSDRRQAVARALPARRVLKPSPARRYFQLSRSRDHSALRHGLGQAQATKTAAALPQPPLAC